MLHETTQNNVQQLTNFRQIDDQPYSGVTGQFVTIKFNMPLVNDSALATEITMCRPWAFSCSGFYVFITENAKY
jgi:hypothetical protein